MVLSQGVLVCVCDGLGLGRKRRRGKGNAPSGFGRPVVLKASGRMCPPAWGRQNVRLPHHPSPSLTLPRPLTLLPPLQGSPVCCYESHSAPFFNLLRPPLGVLTAADKTAVRRPLLLMDAMLDCWKEHEATQNGMAYCGIICQVFSCPAMVPFSKMNRIDKMGGVLRWKDFMGGREACETAGRRTRAVASL